MQSDLLPQSTSWRHGVPSLSHKVRFSRVRHWLIRQQLHHHASGASCTSSPNSLWSAQSVSLSSHGSIFNLVSQVRADHQGAGQPLLSSAWTGLSGSGLYTLPRHIIRAVYTPCLLSPPRGVMMLLLLLSKLRPSTMKGQTPNQHTATRSGSSPYTTFLHLSLFCLIWVIMDDESNCVICPKIKIFLWLLY